MKKQKTKRVNGLLIFSICLLILAIATPITLSFFTAQKSATSNITFGKIELKEGYTQVVLNTEDLLPGSKIFENDVVVAKDIFSEDMIVRASVAYTVPANNNFSTIGLNGDITLLQLLNGAEFIYQAGQGTNLYMVTYNNGASNGYSNEYGKITSDTTGRTYYVLADNVDNGADSVYLGEESTYFKIVSSTKYKTNAAGEYLDNSNNVVEDASRIVYEGTPVVGSVKTGRISSYKAVAPNGTIYDQYINFAYNGNDVNMSTSTYELVSTGETVFKVTVGVNLNGNTYEYTDGTTTVTIPTENVDTTYNTATIYVIKNGSNYEYTDGTNTATIPTTKVNTGYATGYRWVYRNDGHFYLANWNGTTFNGQTLTAGLDNTTFYNIKKSSVLNANTGLTANGEKFVYYSLENGINEINKGGDTQADITTLTGRNAIVNAFFTNNIFTVTNEEITGIASNGTMHFNDSSEPGTPDTTSVIYQLTNTKAQYNLDPTAANKTAYETALANYNKAVELLAEKLGINGVQELFLFIGANEIPTSFSQSYIANPDYDDQQPISDSNKPYINEQAGKQFNVSVSFNAIQSKYLIANNSNYTVYDDGVTGHEVGTIDQLITAFGSGDALFGVSNS